MSRENRAPTSILSAEGRRTIFRSFRSRQVTDEFLSEFSAKATQFAQAVKLQHSTHTRGEFGYFNFGFQHAYGNNKGVSQVDYAIYERQLSQIFQVPDRVKPHKTHKEAADALLMSPEFKVLV